MFAHVGAILLVTTYMRKSQEISWIPLFVLGTPFPLTFVHKLVHFLVLLSVIGIQLWFWHERGQHISASPYYVSGVLLTIIAAGPI